MEADTSNVSPPISHNYNVTAAVGELDRASTSFSTLSQELCGRAPWELDYISAAWLRAASLLNKTQGSELSDRQRVVMQSFYHFDPGGACVRGLIEAVFG
jgi:hypothetical protein